MTKTVPSFLYGTAWKEDATERCVLDALAAGFRGIDTANQRKHYYEEGVGRAIAKSGIARELLFVQTKFTYVDSQDHRLPFDRRAPIATQVAQSFAKSLEHLQTSYLDSLVLHGPSTSEGLGRDDQEAWRAMEALVDNGVSALGVSNVTAGQVDDFVAFARIAPKFVQNRCYAKRGWDRAVRTTCARHGIRYQGFSLLTANPHVLRDRGVLATATRYGKTPAQIVFRFAQQIDMLPLTGTQNPEHMRQDLAIEDFSLTDVEIDAIENIG